MSPDALRRLLAKLAARLLWERFGGRGGGVRRYQRRRGDRAMKYGRTAATPWREIHPFLQKMRGEFTPGGVGHLFTQRVMADRMQDHDDPLSHVVRGDADEHENPSAVARGMYDTAELGDIDGGDHDLRVSLAGREKPRFIARYLFHHPDDSPGRRRSISYIASVEPEHALEIARHIDQHAADGMGTARPGGAENYLRSRFAHHFPTTPEHNA